MPQHKAHLKQQWCVKQWNSCKCKFEDIRRWDVLQLKFSNLSLKSDSQIQAFQMHAVFYGHVTREIIDRKEIKVTEICRVLSRSLVRYQIATILGKKNPFSLLLNLFFLPHCLWSFIAFMLTVLILLLSLFFQKWKYHL